MLDKMICNILRKQLECGAIPLEDREIYQYGYTVLFELMIHLLAAILISLIFSSGMIVFVFLLLYVPIRTYAGGYHAKNYIRCTMMSAFVVAVLSFLMPIAVENLDLNLFTLNSIFLVSTLIICTLAPIESENKPLMDIEKINYGKKVRKLVIWQWILANVFYCMYLENLFMIIQYVHITLSIALLAGWVDNQRRCRKKIIRFGINA